MTEEITIDSDCIIKRDDNIFQINVKQLMHQSSALWSIALLGSAIILNLVIIIVFPPPLDVLYLIISSITTLLIFLYYIRRRVWILLSSRMTIILPLILSSGLYCIFSITVSIIILNPLFFIVSSIYLLTLLIYIPLFENYIRRDLYKRTIINKERQSLGFLYYKIINDELKIVGRLLFRIDQIDGFWIKEIYYPGDEFSEGETVYKLMMRFKADSGVMRNYMLYNSRAKALVEDIEYMLNEFIKD